MKGIGGQDLVPVHSLDELRAGMTVVVRCRKRGLWAGVLLHEVPIRGPIVHVEDLRSCGAPRSWRTTFIPTPTCFCLALERGKLFRLRDLDAKDEALRELRASLDGRRMVVFGLN